MMCLICKNGSINLGKTTVMLQRNECTIIFKNVPADICDNCGEYYLKEEVAGQILQRAEEAVKKGTEVEILRYAA